MAYGIWHIIMVNGSGGGGPDRWWIMITIKRCKFAIPPILVPRANGRSEGGEGEEKEGAGGVRQGYNPKTIPSFALPPC
jgi:hypothetical protein